jgi:diguanylate cyclase
MMEKNSCRSLFRTPIFITKTIIIRLCQMISFTQPRDIWLKNKALNFLWRTLAGFCMLVAIALATVAPQACEAASTIALDSMRRTVELWPSATFLHDPDAKLTIADVIASPNQFVPLKSAYATLGLRQKVMWLQIPVSVAANAHADWIFDIDYALLNRADVYLIHDGKIIREAALGLSMPQATRPIRSRSLAVELDFKPGAEHRLILRIDTPGAMILPITLNSHSAFHARALNEQMLQGLLTSLVLCLILYSVLQWVGLREPLYIKYAFLIFGSGLFSVHFFGIGEQYLWPDQSWIGNRTAGLSSLLAAFGTTLFVADVLGGDMSPKLRIAMRVVGGIFVVTAIGYALNLVDIYVVSLVMSFFGAMPSLLGVPGAVARMRRGDRTGAYFIAAWVTYAIASVVMIGVVRGAIGANFWTLHSFQIGATIDMLIFLRIAVLRSAAVHRAALQATLEHDALLSLAHSDPLTGLLNRRGLQATLLAALPKATAQNILALYMLDLDQFKPVNDQHGHDVGDELLVVAASRLRATMRAGDVVARLGGDEFVVMASGLHSEKQARELGHKLLDAFRLPFSLTQHTCHVGITIGYALAPADGNDPLGLLKSADAAMYVGKQNGKNCVRRIGMSLVSAE